MQVRVEDVKRTINALKARKKRGEKKYPVSIDGLLHTCKGILDLHKQIRDTKSKLEKSERREQRLKTRIEKLRSK